MMRLVVTIGALALAGICFWIAYFAPTPAHAAECRDATAEKVFADIDADGGVILGTLNYDGVYGDTLVFFELGGNLWMIGLKGECFQAGPTLMDEIQKKDTGQPA